MTPILFYGVPLGCSFGSIVALEWLGKPYRLCRVQMPEEVSSDAYRRLNPVGETPTLMTAAGETISESVAILNHIGAQGIERGISFRQGTPEFDRLNAMIGFLNTTFFDSFAPLWHALEHGSEGTEKEVLVAYGRAKVQKAHRNLETLLGGRDWLVGDRPTLADAYFVGIARWADFHRVLDRSDYPAVHRLHERLQNDPAVRFAHAIEDAKPVDSSAGFQGHVTLEEVLDSLPQAA